VVSENQIRESLHSIGIALDPAVAANDSLYDRGLIDSLGLISVIETIQRDFHITVPEQDLLPRNFDSVEAIANYVNSRREQLSKVS